jgi:hypothetical protein
LPNNVNRPNKSRKDLNGTSTGLPTAITLDIPVHWTPGQARAVVTLLDSLRDLIWARYGLRVLDEFRGDDDYSDPPF